MCTDMITVVSVHTTQMPLPASLTARWGHTSGVIHKGAKHVRTVLFAGCPDDPTKYAFPDDYPFIGETTVVDIGE